MKSRPRSPQLEKAREQQRRPNAAKKKKKNKVAGEENGVIQYYCERYCLEMGIWEEPVW